MTDFYLGTHKPQWLPRVDVRLFISHRRLRERVAMPRARAPWALDSGGFTELSTFGHWTITPGDYIAAIRTYRDEIGHLEWAAPQDWMCEPWILAKTGLTTAEHQRLTIDNYLELRTLAADLPIIPVLQGFELDDYRYHVDQYASAGVDLTELARVGIGSVCRRQDSGEVAGIIAHVAELGIRLHGFGVKGDGIRRYGTLLASADSMAWSARGRRIRPCPHTGVTSCNNCLPHALEWRHRALTGTPQPIQLTLI